MELCSMWSFFVTSFLHFFQFFDFPGGPDGKASVYNAGDPDSVRGSGRSPGEGNGNPLQYSCLENAMDRGAWQATVHGVQESDTTEQCHFFHLTQFRCSSECGMFQYFIPSCECTAFVYVFINWWTFSLFWNFQAVVSNAAMNIRVHIFKWIYIFFFL